MPETRQVVASQQEFPFVNITSNGQVFYNTEPVAIDDVATRVLEDSIADTEAGEKPGVYVRAHRNVPWEIIAPIVQRCADAEINVQMVTKPMERAP